VRPVARRWRRAAGRDLASDRPGAIGLLLPPVQRDLELSGHELVGIADRAADTDEGGLIDPGAEGPAAAARLDIDGAESGVLYVSSPSGAAPCDVRAAAPAILAGL
jgi:hypothetical protein